MLLCFKCQLFSTTQTTIFSHCQYGFEAGTGYWCILTVWWIYYCFSAGAVNGIPLPPSTAPPPVPVTTNQTNHTSTSTVTAPVSGFISLIISVGPGLTSRSLLNKNLDSLKIVLIKRFTRKLSFKVKCQQTTTAQIPVWITFHLSILATQKELVLASSNGNVRGACTIFSRHNSPNSLALVGSEWENWVALIHEQSHSDQNQFWFITRGRTGQMESDPRFLNRYGRSI